MSGPGVGVQHSYDYRKGYLLLAFTAVVWGTHFPLLKWGLDYSPPMLFTVLRMIVGTVTMIGVAAWWGVLRLPDRADWPVIISMGLFQNMFFILLVTIGLLYLPAGRAAILAYTSPIWVAPAAAIFLGERLTWPRLLGVVLGVGGLLLLFGPLSLGGLDREGLLGAALILLATILWTGALMHVRLHRWRGDVISLMPWQLLLSLGVLIPLALVFEDPATIVWDPDFLWILLFGGAFASGLAVAAQVGAMRLLPAVSLSLSSMAVPAVGILSAIVMLDEIPTRLDLMAFLLIAGGILVVGWSDHRHARKQVQAKARQQAAVSSSHSSRDSRASDE